MRTVSLFVALTLLAGGLSVGSAGKPPETREQMVIIAKQELKRRKLPLPKRYEVKVEEGFSRTEIRPPARIFGVFFKFIYRGAKDTVYIVWFDENGKIEVAGYRSVLPLGP
jgi:hypothetical protein